MTRKIPETDTLMNCNCDKVEVSGKVGKAGYHIGKKCYIYIESFRHNKKKRIRVLKNVSQCKMILGEP